MNLKKTTAVIILTLFVLTLFACSNPGAQEKNEEKTAVQAAQLEKEKEETQPVTEETEEQKPEQPQEQTEEDKETEDTEDQKEEETEPQPLFTELKEGAKSEDVRKLQQRLIDLGYLKIDEATDYYGSVTAGAVKRFQQQNGLSTDGIAGEKTQTLLYSDNAEECTLTLAGITIGLDPGHQAKGNNEHEPIAPGSSETKPKVSSGTSGSYSGVDEYKVNLAVALILRDLLEEEGANVVMTHDTADVDISNIERAQFFNEHKTDYALRIHANDAGNSSSNGAFVIIPTKNPYLDDCKRAAQLLIDNYCENTDFANKGVVAYDNQTGFNWCERMIINIEMGHMSNEHDDLLLTDSDYQHVMANAIKKGIMAYFS